MFKRLRIAFLLVTIVVLSAVISACGGETTTTANSSPTTTADKPKCESGTITFDGSSVLYPLAKDVAGAYKDACTGATITPTQSGSNVGLQANWISTSKSSHEKLPTY